MNKTLSKAIEKAVRGFPVNKVNSNYEKRPNLFSLSKETELFQNNKGIIIKIDRSRDEKLTNFGKATLVVAIPDPWIDVQTVADLEEIAFEFRDKKKKRLRVATKYVVVLPPKESYNSLVNFDSLYGIGRYYWITNTVS